MRTQSLALLLAGLALCPLANAEVGFTTVELAPVVKDWEHREHRLKSATLVELSARVTGGPASGAVVDITRTPAGTVACVRTPAKPCAALRTLGVDLNAADLFQALTGQASPGVSKRVLPGHATAWPLPAGSQDQNTSTTFGQWAFNPEAGMPMPEKATITRAGKTLSFDMERFFLEPASPSL